MLAQVSIFPIGAGVSISKVVAEAISEVDRSGLEYRVTSMGTVIEGEWNEVFQVIKKMRDRALKKSARIYVTIGIDDRKFKGSRIDRKVRKVEKLLRGKLKS